MSGLSRRQARALELLSAPAATVVGSRRRSLYQTRDLTTYCIDWTGDEQDVPELSEAEALDLVARAGLVPTYPASPDSRCWQVPTEAST